MSGFAQLGAIAIVVDVPENRQACEAQWRVPASVNFRKSAVPNLAVAQIAGELSS